MFCGSRLEACISGGVGSLDREEWRKSVHREAWTLKGFANLAPIRRSRNIAVHVSCDEEAGGIHGLKVAVRVVLVEVSFILSTKH